LNSVDFPTLGRPLMAIVNDISDPCARNVAHVNVMKNQDQRVKVPLGSGAGKGAADCGCCADCADWAGWAAV
jgi:hypothetical protein